MRTPPSSAARPSRPGRPRPPAATTSAAGAAASGRRHDGVQRAQRRRQRLDLRPRVGARGGRASAARTGARPRHTGCSSGVRLTATASSASATRSWSAKRYTCSSPGSVALPVPRDSFMVDLAVAVDDQLGDGADADGGVGRAGDVLADAEAVGARRELAHAELVEPVGDEDLARAARPARRAARAPAPPSRA